MDVLAFMSIDFGLMASISYYMIKSIALPATTKKAVAILKGNSSVHGLVTLTQQQDNGSFSTLPH